MSVQVYVVLKCDGCSQTVRIPAPGVINPDASSIRDAAKKRDWKISQVVEHGQAVSSLVRTALDYCPACRPDPIQPSLTDFLKSEHPQ